MKTRQYARVPSHSQLVLYNAGTRIARAYQARETRKRRKSQTLERHVLAALVVAVTLTALYFAL